MSLPRFCPICNAPWRSTTNYCAACGADVYDPDVRAFVAAGKAEGAPVDNPAVQAAAGEEGALGAGGVLGVRREALLDGSALRRLGLIGGALCALGFVMPAQRLWKWLPPLRYGEDPHLETTLRYAWQLVDDGPKLALLFPALAAIVGFVVAFAPGLRATVRAQLLAATGLIGVVACLGPLGGYGFAPTSIATLATLGALVAGTSVAARLLDAQSQPARIGMIAGAALVFVGLAIPTTHLAERVHLELTWQHLPEGWAVPLLELGKVVMARAITVLFVAMWMLAPLVLAPAAAVLGWQRPKGVWDKEGLALRPVGWALVLWLPLLYAWMAFSAVGWDDPNASSALVGRMRLGVLSLPFALWAQFGAIGALAGKRLPRALARSARQA